MTAMEASAMQTVNFLTISGKFKHIPYVAEQRAEGDSNYGFMPLKGRPEADSEAIAEVVHMSLHRMSSRRK